MTKTNTKKTAKIAASRPLPSFSKYYKESKKAMSPMAIVRKLAKTYPYILIHPEGKGYSYKVLWQDWGKDKNNMELEIVASAHKTHKTKQSCVSAIKKLNDFWGSSFGSLKHAYDHNGKEVDIEIKAEVKRFF